MSGSFQSSSALLEPGYIIKHDSSAMLKTPIINTAASSWSNNSLQKTTNLLHGTKPLNFPYFKFGLHYHGNSCGCYLHNSEGNNDLSSLSYCVF